MFFFFNDTATTEIYTLSLHDALPILQVAEDLLKATNDIASIYWKTKGFETITDRKSTRLNSSHLVISYAVFCLKKKKKNGMTSVVKKLDVHSTIRKGDYRLFH